ncbi:MAG: extracellular solute-binding protein [Anaerolineaceae bacterium]|nr:extracellular solute-binding protein [Anaerolineaceae bacterium]NTV36021.1 extracellular solute-binding protein [Anaerolineaceae bacterium]
MKNSKLFVVLSVLLALGILLSACAPAAPATEAAVVATDAQPQATEAPAAEPVTITFWHGYNADVEAKFLDETLIPEFEALHPDIKVNAIVVPYDQFRRKLLIALSGGESPDLARVDIIWVPELADQGALAKLDETLPDFSTVSGAMLPGPLSTNFYKGNYYGLPLDTNTRVMAYNKDVFAAAGIETPPATMDEFLAACEKIKALGNDTYCFADGGTYAWATNPWIWSFGGDVTDPEITKSTGFFNSKATVDAYNFLKDGIDKGYINPSMKGGSLDSWGAFSQDKVAMIFEGPWFPPSFEKQFPDKKYGLALIPAGAGGSTSVVGGEDIVMFQQSDKKEAAAEFMRFMLSEDVQLKWASQGQVPVLKSAIDSDYIKTHPFFGIFLEQLKTAKARTPHPSWSKMEEITTNVGNAILNGTIETQKALDEAAAKLDALLAPAQ